MALLVFLVVICIIVGFVMATAGQNNAEGLAVVILVAGWFLMAVAPTIAICWIVLHFVFKYW